MANPVIETFDQRALVLKLEATEGTDAAPTPAANAFQILDGKSKIVADSIERKLDRVYFNSKRKKTTNMRGTIEGGFELASPAAPGTDSASFGPLLQICGMAESMQVADVGPPELFDATIYNPITRLIPSATAWFWHAGTLRKLLATRGNISSLAMEINKYPMGQMSLEGSCIDVLEDDLPDDCDYSDFLEPMDGSTESMELLINDFAVNGLSHSIDFGNKIKQLQHTEARSTRITTKDTTFKARFYRTAKADFDPWAKWRVNDIIVVQGTTLEPSDRYTKFTTRGEITGVEEVDIEGDYGIEITCMAVASDAGNDEVLVECGQH